MKRNNTNSSQIVKTALLLISLLTVPTLAQVPAPAPNAATNAAAATNSPAAAADKGAVTATNSAATNVTVTATNFDARRRALLQNATNRFPRFNTNAAGLAVPPAPTNVVTVPAPAVTPPANVAGQIGPPAPGSPGPSPTPLPTATAPGGAGQAESAEFSFKFYNAPVDQILEKYSEITGRTVLRPASLPTPAVTIITASPLTRSEAIQALDGALSLNGTTMIPQGERFVKAVPSAEAPQHGAAISRLTDGEYPDSEQFVTHIVQLKTAKPTELAGVLQLFTRNPAGIVPIDSNQLLVIRDVASNIKRMLELIDEVDVPPQSDYKLEVIPIKYGKVTDLFDTMNALISGAAGGGYPAAGARGAPTRRPGQIPTTGGTLGTSGRYGSRTGASGQPLGAQPGQLGATQPGTTPGAASFQQRLQQIVNRAAGTSEIQLLTDARIVPDERSNSLIVFANRQDMQTITNIVSKVDVLLAQVLIEGVVMSVALGNEYNLGVSWLQKPVSLGNNSVGAGGINNGQGFLTNITSLAGSLPSGFSYFANLGKNFDVSLAALASDNRTRILQRPRLQTSHAVQGSFFIGKTVPYVTGFYDYGGFSTGVSSRSTVEQIQVGVDLEVTPFITPDGLVVMDVAQDISSIESFAKIDNNDVPTTSTRRAQTTLSVRDGETIMLGGYIEDNRTTTKSGVPILKDIPGIGALFRTKTKKNDRSELILLMHVTILKNPADAGAQVEREKAKLPGVSDADKEFKRAEEQSVKKSGALPQP